MIDEQRTFIVHARGETFVKSGTSLDTFEMPAAMKWGAMLRPHKAGTA